MTAATSAHESSARERAQPEAAVSGARPRALLIAPVWPDPDGTGPSQRAYHWLVRLARTHQVDLIAIWRLGFVPAVLSPTVEELPVARCVALAPTPTNRNYRRRFGWKNLCAWPLGRAGAFGPKPEWGFVTAAARRELARALAGRRYDRAVCFRVQVSDYADHFVAAGFVPAAAMEIDCDDLESATRRSIADGLARRGRTWAAWRLRHQARRAVKLERELARRYRLTVAAPEDVAELSARRPGTRVGVVPNLIGRLPPLPLPGDPHRLLFVGTLGYFPNEDAVRFLLDDVLPGLRREDPRWTLVVAGRGAPAELVAMLARRDGVEFAGAVADLEPLYFAAGIVVVPVRHGGGTKIKVAEGLAHGRPVIATPHAARGWALRPGETYRRADAPVEWCAACRELAADPALRARLGSAGRAHVARHFLDAADPAP